MARRSIAAILFGAVLIVIWGVELIHSAALLFRPVDTSIPEIADYVSRAKVWSLLRALVATVGIAAGILVYRERRLGHWLSIASALGVLLFTDWLWFKMLWPGVVHSSPFTFFFVSSPALGYAVIVVPIIAATFFVLSARTLIKNRAGRAI